MQTAMHCCCRRESRAVQQARQAPQPLRPLPPLPMAAHRCRQHGGRGSGVRASGWQKALPEYCRIAVELGLPHEVCRADQEAMREKGGVGAAVTGAADAVWQVSVRSHVSRRRVAHMTRTSSARRTRRPKGWGTCSSRWVQASRSWTTRPLGRTPTFYR